MSVAIETNEGRYKASARLTMEYPEVLDDWPDSRQTVFVKNKEVSVCVGNSGMVANTDVSWVLLMTPWTKKGNTFGPWFRSSCFSVYSQGLLRGGKGLIFRKTKDFN